MNRKVLKFIKTYSNPPSRWPVAWSELDCGHTSEIRFASLDDKVRRAHDESYYLTKIGDVVQCDCCDRQTSALNKLRAMKPGDLSHSRFRARDSRGFGPGDYYIYGRDPKSPTGVHLLFSLEASPEADDALRAIHVSPLSPTEPR